MIPRRPAALTSRVLRIDERDGRLSLATPMGRHWIVGVSCLVLPLAFFGLQWASPGSPGVASLIDSRWLGMLADLVLPDRSSPPLDHESRLRRVRVDRPGPGRPQAGRGGGSVRHFAAPFPLLDSVLADPNSTRPDRLVHFGGERQQDGRVDAVLHHDRVLRAARGPLLRFPRREAARSSIGLAGMADLQSARSGCRRLRARTGAGELSREPRLR